MAKKRGKPSAVQTRSKQRSASNDAKPNLFEKLYNRKKFDILGKKAKGERKHGKSVHDATEKVRAVKTLRCLTHTGSCTLQRLVARLTLYQGVTV